MAGTVAGGKKAAAKNLRNDPDFYKRIGAIGGSNGTLGGFATPIPCECDTIKGNHYVSNCAGVRGGRTSRRKSKKHGAA